MGKRIYGQTALLCASGKGGGLHIVLLAAPGSTSAHVHIRHTTLVLITHPVYIYICLFLGLFLLPLCLKKRVKI